MPIPRDLVTKGYCVVECKVCDNPVLFTDKEINRDGWEKDCPQCGSVVTPKTPMQHVKLNRSIFN